MIIRFRGGKSHTLSRFTVRKDAQPLPSASYDNVPCRHAIRCGTGRGIAGPQGTRYGDNGLELESSVALNNHFELFANIGLLHAEVDSIEAYDLDQEQFVTKQNLDQAKSPK